LLPVEIWGLRWIGLEKRKVLVSSVLLLVFLAVAFQVSTVAASTSSSNVNGEHSGGNIGFWYRKAVKAIKASRFAIRRAAQIIKERREEGIDVSTSVKLLKASVKLHKAAVRLLVDGKPRRSLFSALLSILVARDAVKAAVENPEEAVAAIPGRVEAKIEEVKKFLDRLEEEDVDVALPRRILETAEKLNGKGGNLIGEGKPVRGVVTSEAGRTLALLSQTIASRSR